MIPTARPHVMFLSDMCLLDRNSGAAMEMHDWLRLLARNGFDASSVTMSLFDGGEEYPFRREIAPAVDPAEHVGKRIRVKRDGIEHNIFNTGTSIATRLTPELVRGFVACAAEDIRRLRPDVVIGYGSVNLVPLRALARSLGARCVFYLANDSYDESRRACFEQIDSVVTPSQALAVLYRERLGLQATVLGNYIPEFEGVAKPSKREVEGRRSAGFVTMVNPSLVKGGLHFLQIAAVMKKLEPDLTFLALESRGTRAQMEAFVTNAANLDNIWWLPRQADMHRVYRRSALLLVPSMWFEAAGRIVPEAQLHGVPVLAHRVGALEEQVGGGGEMIDIPERLKGSMTELPRLDEVTPWVSAIRTLLHSPDRYAEMSRRAFAAAQRHRPESRSQEILGFFQSLLASKTEARSA